MARKSRSRSRRGGLAALLKQAAVPLGLVALTQSRKHRKKHHKKHGTRKGMARKTARRAYMKKKGGRKTARRAYTKKKKGAGAPPAWRVGIFAR